MIYCIVSSKNVVSFVEELIGTLNLDLQLITITPPEKSEDYCVSVVTSSLSAEIQEKVYQYFEDYWNI